MPVRHIKVDNPVAPKTRDFSYKLDSPNERNALSVRNVQQIERDGPSAVCQPIEGPAGMSEPRSGGPQSRAMPIENPVNVAAIESGHSLSVQGTNEVHNDDKFLDPNRIEVVIPPQGFERIPGRMDDEEVPINDPAKTHGYDPSHLAAGGGEAVNPEYNRYPFRQKIEERASGIVGDEVPQWGQPKIVMGRKRNDKKFLERGDVSVDNGEAGNVTVTGRTKK